jgi:hypothetical protein
MLTLKAQIDKLPEHERPFAVRAARSVLNEVLLSTALEKPSRWFWTRLMDLNRKAYLVEVISAAIEMLQSDFPEADDNAPMKKTIVYESE